MERRRSGGRENGSPDPVPAAQAAAAQAAATAVRRARVSGPSALDVSDVSTASATSVPSSAGGAFEQEMQRRILGMESKLKDVDALIKDQMPQAQQRSEVPPLQEMQQELDETERYRQSLQARADELEKTLQKERAEHKAATEHYSNQMNKSVELMRHSVEQSLTESNHLMKARMVEAESVIRKLVSHMNRTFDQPSKEGATQPSELVDAMSQMLEEHQHLVQQQQQLLAQRTTFAPGRLIIPTWQAVPPQGYVKASTVLPPQADGSRSPGRLSPVIPVEGSPAKSGHNGPRRTPQSSPSSKSLSVSPGARSPGSKSPRSSMSPRVRAPLGDQEELCTTGMRFAEFADARPSYET